MFGAKNVQLNHPYGSTIALRKSEDECFCPVALVRVFSQNKRQRAQKWEVLCHKEMGPAISISNATIAKWLKERLILANIMASGGSTRKAAISYAARKHISIKTIMESGDWAHTFTMYGNYIRCPPREVLLRIIKQTSGGIQVMNMVVVATDNHLWWDGVMQPSPTHRQQGRDLSRRAQWVLWASFLPWALTWIESRQSMPKCVFLAFCEKFDCHSVIMLI